MKVRSHTVLIAVVCAVLFGCGRPQVEFSLNEKSDELIVEAQQALQETLDEHFGRPNELVAWLKLPVDYGEAVTVPGTLKSFDPKKPGRLVAQLAAPSQTTFSGLHLQWLSGENKGNLFKVSDFDARAGVLSVQPGLQKGAVEGDQFQIITRLPGWRLKHGRNLYMIHCLHCHGVSGDGKGATAEFLNPQPRDFRKGILKFTSTAAGVKPNRSDFETTLFNGIPGTYMPSFKLVLKGEDMAAVIEYVRWLAMRGEFETLIISDLSNFGGSADDMQQATKADIIKEFNETLQSDLADSIDEIAGIIADNWNRAEDPDNVVWPKQPRTPYDDPESIKRGRALFVSKDTKCTDCHGPAGYGDGSLTEDFQEIPGTNEKYKEPGLHDDWGNLQKPRNLRLGRYRGGRRPIDIYRRIHSGIKGTQMPGFSTVLKDDDKIWDLVNYVMHLPFEEPGFQTSAEQNKLASKP